MPKFTKHKTRPIYGLSKVDDCADVVIGGQGNTFLPSVRSEKWANKHGYKSSWLEITAQGVVESNTNKRKIKKVRDKEVLTSEFGRKNRSGKYTTEHHEWYVGDSLDWDVIYTAKDQLPEELDAGGDYVVRFDLSKPAGLDFYHQPALTQDEIERGDERPDDIINSYAVMLNVSGHYQSNGESLINYESGKYGHLYRPVMILPDGSKHWGRQLIVGSELLVYIPQEVVNAWNPSDGDLVLDPTFGYTSLGGSAGSSTQNRVHVSDALTYVASAGDTITAFTLYQNSPWSNPMEMSVYSIVAGNAVSKLGASGYIATSVPDGWKTVSGLSVTMSGGTRYGSAWGGQGNGFQYKYDSGTGTQMQLNTTSGLPATWTSSGNNTRRGSMYATYEVAPPVVSGVRSVMIY